MLLHRRARLGADAPRAGGRADDQGRRQGDPQPLGPRPLRGRGRPDRHRFGRRASRSPTTSPPARRSTRCWRRPEGRARPGHDGVDREWGGYTGYFGDPDGFRWEVAWAPATSARPCCPEYAVPSGHLPSLGRRAPTSRVPAGPAPAAPRAGRGIPRRGSHPRRRRPLRGLLPAGDGINTLHADVLRPKGIARDKRTPVILTVSPYINHWVSRSRTASRTRGQRPVLRLPRPQPDPRARLHLRDGGPPRLRRLLGMQRLGRQPGAGRRRGRREVGGLQRWSTGKVGMLGKSYDAWTGLMGVAQRPPGSRRSSRWSPSTPATTTSTTGVSGSRTRCSRPRSSGHRRDPGRSTTPRSTT